MYKDLCFGLFLIGSLLMSALTFNVNLLSNAMAQEYDYNTNYNNYDDSNYSSYPTKEKKYECQKGPFEGFFVSSVEFCDPELPVKDPIEKKDKKVQVKDAIVNIEKKLFVCDEPMDDQSPPTREFFCKVSGFDLPFGPDSGEYIPCTADICPSIDESDFAVQIFKDVATVRDLTPQGTQVNLDKFHYTVAESEISNNIDFTSDGPGPISETDSSLFEPNFCSTTGFTHGLLYQKHEVRPMNDIVQQYVICVNYEGDCEGIIHPGEVKTCTVENYIVYANPLFDNTFNGANTETTTGTPTTQSNTPITTQSNNAITTTPTTTQSSNIGGVPQSSSIGATAALQSSNVGTPNTLPSSTPSSPLLNTP